ncbi:MAG: fused MFS/spermidine synthase [Burkholderiales bacterium]|nr:fused MFS/spermidine synthase [Burkholderiales bacterium]
MLVYAATILVSAFLLFLVQPVIAKQILPWFGGSAAVWTTCLVFFQFLLLFGYAYSDLTTRRMRPRSQVWLHCLLLVLSLATLPIIPDAVWKPAGGEDPVLRILGLLAATIGLPYFLLSTTGPLVQAWFARSFPSGTVYRLFALSNFGSLLALIAYPPLIEPWIPTRAQSLSWSAGYALFVALCIAAGIFSLRAAGNAAASAVLADAEPGGSAPVAREYVLWLLLAAMGSYMLLAVTNHITQNVASVPFLWILPLILYLITFILCFEGRGWYQRRFFLGPLAVTVLAMAWGLHAGGEIMEVTDAVPLYCAGLLVCCMFYHGELAALKPAPRYLTRFYLMVSLGGALGGLFVGVIAPLVFVTYYEFGIGLVITALLALYLLWPLPKWIPALALGVAVACTYFVVEYIGELKRGTILMTRNFYGTLRVKDSGPVDEPTTVRRLMHGVIMHGEQYLEPRLSRQPTSYYGPDSGIGLAIRHYAKRPLKLGVIGLGTGTLAAWGKSGDVFRFYELDPQVLTVARRDFTYLNDTAAGIQAVIGDARLNLEREPPQGFDILVIDAFSSDSIPVHLITREALAVYMRHMAPDGIIAFHVTNRYLDLPPVVQKLADAAGIAAVFVSHDPEEHEQRYSRTDWILLTHDQSFHKSDPVQRAQSPVHVPSKLSLWTDDFNNLLQILK